MQAVQQIKNSFNYHNPVSLNSKDVISFIQSRLINPESWNILSPELKRSYIEMYKQLEQKINNNLEINKLINAIERSITIHSSATKTESSFVTPVKPERFIKNAVQIIKAHLDDFHAQWVKKATPEEKQKIIAQLSEGIELNKSLPSINDELKRKEISTKANALIQDAILDIKILAGQGELKNALSIVKRAAPDFDIWLKKVNPETKMEILNDLQKAIELNKKSSNINDKNKKKEASKHAFDLIRYSIARIKCECGEKDYLSAFNIIKNNVPNFEHNFNNFVEVGDKLQIIESIVQGIKINKSMSAKNLSDSERKIQSDTASCMIKDSLSKLRSLTGTNKILTDQNVVCLYSQNPNYILGNSSFIKFVGEGEFHIGSGNLANEIKLIHDSSIANNQAKIMRNKAGEVFLSSSNKDNPVILNGEKVLKGQIKLRVEDELKLGNTVLIFDGQNLRTLTNDAQTYYKFNPKGLRNNDIKQGQLGNCYLVAAEDNFLNDIDMKVLMANMIKTTNNSGVEIFFYGAKEKVHFTKEEIPKILQEARIKGSDGLKLIERAYAVKILEERMKRPNHEEILKKITDKPPVLALSEAGYPSVVMNSISPYKKKEPFLHLKDSGSRIKAESILAKFNENPGELRLTASTIEKKGEEGKGHDVILATFGALQIAQTHAYNIKSVDPIKKQITLSNPWGQVGTIPYEDFFKYFCAIYKHIPEKQI